MTAPTEAAWATHPTVGVTAFSLGNEWAAGGLDVTALLEEVAVRGLGPGLELVAGQLFRGVPLPTADEVRAFRRDVGRLGLVPTCYGVDVDVAACAGRWLDHDGAVVALADQLRAGRSMGFGLARTSLGVSVDVLQAVLPVLEQLDVVLTIEIQGSNNPHTGPVTELVTALERLQSAHLGVTFDTSVSMPRLPVTYLAWLEREARSEALLDAVTAAWAADSWGPGLAADLVPLMARERVGQHVVSGVVGSLIRFGRTSPSAWVHVLPWARHVHAKFWDWADPVTDTQFQAVYLRMLAERGYAGAISSEWGGSAWLDRHEVDAFQITADHVGLLRDLSSTE